MNNRNSPPEMFLEKDVLKICSKFTEEHSCRRMISIKLLCNFIEITLWHGCFFVNLLHIFRTSFPEDLRNSRYLVRFLLYLQKILRTGIKWIQFFNAFLEKIVNLMIKRIKDYLTVIAKDKN